MYLVILNTQLPEEEVHLFHNERNAMGKYVELVKKYGLASVYYKIEELDKCLLDKALFIELMAHVNKQPNTMRQIKFLEVVPQDVSVSENTPPPEVELKVKQHCFCGVQFMARTLDEFYRFTNYIIHTLGSNYFGNISALHCYRDHMYFYSKDGRYYMDQSRRVSFDAESDAISFINQKINSHAKQI